MEYRLNLITPSIYSEPGPKNCNDQLSEDFANYLKHRADNEFMMPCKYDKIPGLAYIHRFEDFEERFLIHSEYAVIIVSPNSMVAIRRFLPRLLVFLTSRGIWQNRVLIVVLGDAEVTDTVVLHAPIKFSLNDWKTHDEPSWIQLFELVKVKWIPYIEEIRKVSVVPEVTQKHTVTVSIQGPYVTIDDHYDGIEPATQQISPKLLNEMASNTDNDQLEDKHNDEFGSFDWASYRSSPQRNSSCADNTLENENVMLTYDEEVKNVNVRICNDGLRLERTENEVIGVTEKGNDHTLDVDHIIVCINEGYSGVETNESTINKYIINDQNSDLGEGGKAGDLNLDREVNKTCTEKENETSIKENMGENKDFVLKEVQKTNTDICRNDCEIGKTMKKDDYILSVSEEKKILNLDIDDEDGRKINIEENEERLGSFMVTKETLMEDIKNSDDNPSAKDTLMLHTEKDKVQDYLEDTIMRKLSNEETKKWRTSVLDKKRKNEKDKSQEVENLETSKDERKINFPDECEEISGVHMKFENGVNINTRDFDVIDENTNCHNKEICGEMDETVKQDECGLGNIHGRGSQIMISTKEMEENSYRQTNEEEEMADIINAPTKENKIYIENLNENGDQWNDVDIFDKSEKKTGLYSNDLSVDIKFMEEQIVPLNNEICGDNETGNNPNEDAEMRLKENDSGIRDIKHEYYPTNEAHIVDKGEDHSRYYVSSLSVDLKSSKKNNSKGEEGGEVDRKGGNDREKVHKNIEFDVSSEVIDNGCMAINVDIENIEEMDRGEISKGEIRMAFEHKVSGNDGNVINQRETKQHRLEANETRTMNTDVWDSKDIDAEIRKEIQKITDFKLREMNVSEEDLSSSSMKKCKPKIISDKIIYEDVKEGLKEDSCTETDNEKEVNIVGDEKKQYVLEKIENLVTITPYTIERDNMNTMTRCYDDGTQRFGKSNNEDKVNINTMAKCDDDETELLGKSNNEGKVKKEEYKSTEIDKMKVEENVENTERIILNIETESDVMKRNENITQGGTDLFIDDTRKCDGSGGNIHDEKRMGDGHNYRHFDSTIKHEEINMNIHGNNSEIMDKDVNYENIDSLMRDDGNTIGEGKCVFYCENANGVSSSVNASDILIKEPHENDREDINDENINDKFCISFQRVEGVIDINIEDRDHEDDPNLNEHVIHQIAEIKITESEEVGEDISASVISGGKLEKSFDEAMGFVMELDKREKIDVKTDIGDGKEVNACKDNESIELKMSEKDNGGTMVKFLNDIESSIESNFESKDNMEKKNKKQNMKEDNERNGIKVLKIETVEDKITSHYESKDMSNVLTRERTAEDDENEWKMWHGKANDDPSIPFKLENEGIGENIQLTDNIKEGVDETYQTGIFNEMELRKTNIEGEGDKKIIKSSRFEDINLEAEFTAIASITDENLNKLSPSLASNSHNIRSLRIQTDEYNAETSVNMDKESEIKVSEGMHEQYGDDKKFDSDKEKTITNTNEEINSISSSEGGVELMEPLIDINERWECVEDEKDESQYSEENNEHDIRFVSLSEIDNTEIISNNSNKEYISSEISDIEKEFVNRQVMEGEISDDKSVMSSIPQREVIATTKNIGHPDTVMEVSALGLITPENLEEHISEEQVSEMKQWKYQSESTSNEGDGSQEKVEVNSSIRNKEDRKYTKGDNEVESGTVAYIFNKVIYNDGTLTASNENAKDLKTSGHLGDSEMREVGDTELADLEQMSNINRSGRGLKINEHSTDDTKVHKQNATEDVSTDIGVYGTRFVLYGQDTDNPQTTDINVSCQHQDEHRRTLMSYDEYGNKKSSQEDYDTEETSVDLCGLQRVCEPIGESDERRDNRNWFISRITKIRSYLVTMFGRVDPSSSRSRSILLDTNNDGQEASSMDINYSLVYWAHNPYGVFSIFIFATLLSPVVVRKLRQLTLHPWVIFNGIDGLFTHVVHYQQIVPQNSEMNNPVNVYYVSTPGDSASNKMSNFIFQEYHRKISNN